MLTITCKKENLGLILAVSEIIGQESPALNEHVDGTFSYDWCGTDKSEISKICNELIVRAKDVDYNKMYKHVNGSKEFSYSLFGHNYGVFYKEKNITGWFCHKTGEDKKTLGKFFVCL